ncbi:MAG: GDSL-like Lipase/Acylhydrolase family [Planctomycetota bacterium]|jgi:hypothetical protein
MFANAPLSTRDLPGAVLLVVALTLVAPLRSVHARTDERTYRDVPRVTATDAPYFRSLLASASKGVVRVALFGDSQETAPAGFGRQYVAHLNARFAKVFGPATESVIYSNIDQADPPQWLAVTQASRAIVPTTLPADAVLPNFTVRGLLAGTAQPLDWQRTLFLHDAARTTDPLLDNGVWFEPQGPYIAEVLALRRKGSPGLSWRNRPTDLDMLDSNSPVVGSGSLAFGKNTPSGAFEWLASPPLSFGGRRHLQFELRGNSATIGQEMVGVRFRSLAANRGIVVQSIARGGMRLGDILGQHSQSGPMLRALAPQVAVLHLGANDAGYGPTKEEWRAQLVASIAWIRAEMGDPQFPIVLAAELRVSGSITAAAVIDWMPVIAHDLAAADPRILALNLRRITEEEYGWGRWSMRYLVDTAHFMPYAQRLEAEAFVGELTRVLAIPDPGCTSASWADCVRTWGSVCLQGGCAPIIDIEAELFNINWNGAGSNCDDLDGNGIPDECLSAGLGDINNDGFIDGADLAILLADWSLSGSPADLDGDGKVGASDLALLLSLWRS